MSAFLPSGLKPLKQNEDISSLIRQLENAFVTGERSKSRSKAMGCMVMVRSKTKEPTFTPLYDEVSRSAIVEVWNKLKRSVTSHPDAGNLYFHLQGCLFLVVPHVSVQSGGRVVIQFCSSNDPCNPVIKKIDVNLAEGPQAFCVTAGFCLPFLKEQVQFYYSTCCFDTTATIPCSVMAIWNQSIEPRAACYEDEDIVKWMIKKLKHPKLLRSEEHAKLLLRRAYGSDDSRAQDRVVSADLHRRSLDLSQSEVASMQPTRLQFGSRRYLEIQPEALRATIEDEVVHDDEHRRDNFLNTIDEHHALEAQSGVIPKAWNTFLDNLFRSKPVEKDGFFFDAAPDYRIEKTRETFHDAPSSPIKIDLQKFSSWSGEGDGQNPADDIVKNRDWYTSVGLLPKADPTTFSNAVARRFPQVDRARFALWYHYPEEVCPTEIEDVWYMLLKEINDGNIQEPRYVTEAHVYTEEPVDEHDITEDGKMMVETNNIQGMAGKDDGIADLVEASLLFDFGKNVTDNVLVELPLQQPAVVTSQSDFLVDIQDFKWSMSKAPCTQLLSIPLPEILMTSTNARAIGPRIMTFFDAAVIEFSAFVTVPKTLAANGELVLVWDEGNFLGSFGENINQGTLLGFCCLRVSAQSLLESGNPKSLRFRPLGIGKYLPLDRGLDGANVGSLRVYVLNSLQTGTSVQEFTCSLNIHAKVLATNIMQPGRALAQASLGMPQGTAFFSTFPLNHLLFSTKWTTSQRVGSAAMLTFSPASVFVQSTIMQPSAACNLLANCSWWTGECEFEVKFNKTPYHGGRIVIGFGSIASRITNYTDVFSLSHVVCDLNRGDTAVAKVKLESWNGKNFLSAGRKESLPKPSHQARQRIFIVVTEPLQSTVAVVSSVNVTLMLKSINNLTVGGGVPIKPIFGHLAGVPNEMDYFYSEGKATEMSRSLFARTGASHSGAIPLEPHISVREKFGNYSLQYQVQGGTKTARYLVLPVAPWSHLFNSEVVKTSVVCPHIGYCANFTYWKGSLRYRIVIHRKQKSSNIGGILQILLENTGFPMDPGIYEGSRPLSNGGGQSWVFPFGVTQNTCSFTIADDQLFERRLTRPRKLDTATSRLSTRSDRLGNLIIVLPPEDLYNNIDVYIATGSDFSYMLYHPSVASSVTRVGKMDGNVYNPYTSSSGVFAPIEDIDKAFVTA
nr:polyprotein [Cassava Torrado-like virus]